MTAADHAAPVSPALSTAARRFLQPARFGVISCLNADGSPLQAVIWYVLEGDVVVFNSRIGRRWPTNIGRDHRVSLTVADGYEYVEMGGELEIDENPLRGQAVIAGLTRRYEADKETADAQIAGFAKQSRVTFTLRPTRIFERLTGK
ncbi:MAG TPA: pyridoxamine 5'-phosphate oxidase family protein [Terriglobales bacterium]|nr:pyridoxamine 5'-phosphate oxidase family protein [Terriglobales bacterium]